VRPAYGGGGSVGEVRGSAGGFDIRSGGEALGATAETSDIVGRWLGVWRNGRCVRWFVVAEASLASAECPLHYDFFFFFWFFSL
jgi:hypothetical protein